MSLLLRVKRKRKDIPFDTLLVSGPKAKKFATDIEEVSKTLAGTTVTESSTCQDSPQVPNSPKNEGKVFRLVDTLNVTEFDHLFSSSSILASIENKEKNVALINSRLMTNIEKIRNEKWVEEVPKKKNKTKHENVKTANQNNKRENRKKKVSKRNTKKANISTSRRCCKQTSINKNKEKKCT